MLYSTPCCRQESDHNTSTQTKSKQRGLQVESTVLNCCPLVRHPEGSLHVCVCVYVCFWRLVGRGHRTARRGRERKRRARGRRTRTTWGVEGMEAGAKQEVRVGTRTIPTV